MIPLLLRYRKDIVYVLAILALILSFLYYRHSLIVKGENNILTQNKIAVEQRNSEIAAQKTKDDRVLKDAEDAHQKEIQLIKDVSSRPLPPIRLCNEAGSSALSATTTVSSDRSSGAGMVPADSGMHSQGPDISAGLGLLVERADRLSADARKLNAITHPK